MLKCPRCGSVLRTTIYEGVEIESCLVCEGEWLDAGELVQIVQTVERTFTPEEVGALDALRKNVFRVGATARDRLPCPKCPDQELTPFNYASSSGIILDKCPACGGIWLDRKELEMVQALVENWNQGLPSDPAKQRPLTAGTGGSSRELAPGVRVRRVGFVMSVLRAFL